MSHEKAGNRMYVIIAMLKRVGLFFTSSLGRFQL